MTRAPLYLDTSAVLRPVLEAGASPEIEARIRKSSALLTSRLSLVEASRAIHRLGYLKTSQRMLVNAERKSEQCGPAVSLGS